MRTFKLIRLEDLTGVSGTGHVVDGVEMESGNCFIKWKTPAKLADGSVRKINSSTRFDCWQDVVLLHGHGGRTVLEWNDTKERITDLDLLAKEDAPVQAEGPEICRYTSNGSKLTLVRPRPVKDSKKVA